MCWAHLGLFQACAGLVFECLWGHGGDNLSASGLSFARLGSGPAQIGSARLGLGPVWLGPAQLCSVPPGLAWPGSAQAGGPSPTRHSSARFGSAAGHEKE